FAGPSISGKLSALNAITGRRVFARTSKTPGRTQLINFFGLDGHRRLADPPGYGYAKVPEQLKRHWQALLTRYVEARESLAGVVIAMGARGPMTDFDVQLLERAHANGLPAHVLLTKADKLNRSEATTTVRKVTAAWPEGDTAQLFSAVTKAGVYEARARVLQMLGSG